MKSFIAILALVAVAAADVSHLRGAEADATIVKQESDVYIDGYTNNLETSNGIQAQESGKLDNPNSEDAAIAVQGSSSYTSPEGVVVRLTYTADRNGFQPQGDHLPTAPPPQPIPDYILRSLEYIAAHPPKPEVNQNYRQ